MKSLSLSLMHTHTHMHMRKRCKGSYTKFELDNKLSNVWDMALYMENVNMKVICSHLVIGQAFYNLYLFDTNKNL